MAPSESQTSSFYTNLSLYEPFICCSDIMFAALENSSHAAKYGGLYRLGCVTESRLR